MFSKVFIGTDIGKVAPHMFYQACRVSGKNSTPCTEKKIDGTIVIELQLDPAKDMLATCDCVGILKERNVDVEHRFPDQLGTRSKKKSTRCRMIFRTTITHDDGVQETLQVCSQPIVCSKCCDGFVSLKKNLICCVCFIFSSASRYPGNLQEIADGVSRFRGIGVVCFGEEFSERYTDIFSAS